MFLYFVNLDGAIVLERASHHEDSHFESLSAQPLNPNCNIFAMPVFFHVGTDCQS